MNQRERNELDRHITGNYGEDQFDGDVTEMLAEALAEISAIPTHPCDDARNVAGLVKAKMLASEALKKADY